MAETSSSTKGRFYLPQLDGLRFIAFLLVFFSHFRWAPPNIARLPGVGAFLIGLHRHGGWGVDLFLVLSAYLITTLLLLEHRKRGRISLKFFYIRRSLRIWPLYFFFLVLAFFALPLLDGTFSTAAHQDVLGTHGLASTIFVANLAELFTDVAVPKQIGHLWTISLEEQFYVFWPAVLVLLIGRPKAMRMFLVATVVASVATRAALSIGASDVVILKNTVTHFDPLALGSLLALYRLDTPPNERRSTAKLLLGTGLIMFTTMFPRPRTQSMHVIWQYLVVAVGFSFVIDSILGSGKQWICRLLSNQPLVYLGQISYGLYVYHLLGIKYGTQIAEFLGASVESRKGWVLTSVINLLMTIIMSLISYAVLEKPFMRLKKRFALIASRDA